MHRFQDKVVLITGAASPIGMGYATAKRLAQEGARLVITDIRADEIEQRAGELRTQSHEVLALSLDVAAEADWRACLDQLLSRFGGLDVLVNNAGIAMLGPTPEYGLDTWHRQIDVNLTGVFLGCRQVQPLLRARGGGAIVNISSIAGLIGIPGGAAYSASKGGVRLMSKALAVEFAADNIRVNSIHPGVIATDMLMSSEEAIPEAAEATIRAIPLRRLGEAADIAAAVAYLASDDARYVTGTELIVDGGYVAQ